MSHEPKNNGHISPGQAEDAWAELDRILRERRYLRFSLDTSRDWDDATKRQWNAVAFMESGKLLARARRPTRNEAISELVRELILSEPGGRGRRRP